MVGGGEGGNFFKLKSTLAKIANIFKNAPIFILSQVVNAGIVNGFLKDVCANNYAAPAFSNTFLQQ